MEKIYIKIDKKLDVGTNEIEFTPQEEGEYIYSCWMNMIKNKIKVIDNKDYFKEENLMKEVKLNIEGMHCTGCSTRLEKVLNNVDGVEDAKVSLEEKKADIKYDETQVSEKELIEAVEDAGFKAN